MSLQECRVPLVMSELSCILHAQPVLLIVLPALFLDLLSGTKHVVG